MTGCTVRQARADDHEAVVAFTQGTWADRDVDDYIPDVFPEWVEGDGPHQRTFVAEVDGDIAGLCQGVRLGDHEAWAQGMRVNPAYRGMGVSTRLNDAAADWARERGAAAMRNMVFGWNTAGLGASRAAGFDPVTSFRWAHPTPDAGVNTSSDADAAGDYDRLDDPVAGWQYWRESAATAQLGGLGLDLGESWALSEVTLDRFRRADDETAHLTLRNGDGSRATTYRVRDYEREEDGETVRWAEYGVSAWTDPAAAVALFDAVSADAATVGADRARVLVPETARFVSDAVRAAGAVSDHPDYVLSMDLTDR